MSKTWSKSLIRDAAIQYGDTALVADCARFIDSQDALLKELDDAFEPKVVLRQLEEIKRVVPDMHQEIDKAYAEGVDRFRRYQIKAAAAETSRRGSAKPQAWVQLTVDAVVRCQRAVDDFFRSSRRKILRSLKRTARTRRRELRYMRWRVGLRHQRRQLIRLGLACATFLILFVALQIVHHLATDIDAELSRKPLTLFALTAALVLPFELLKVFIEGKLDRSTEHRERKQAAQEVKDWISLAIWTRVAVSRVNTESRSEG